MISLKTTQAKRKVAVIGGGAAGIAAALTAAEQGANVTIFERNERIGKKILATGNGKCNLSNRAMSLDCFHTSDEAKLKSCLERFGVEETIAFFENIGLMIKDKNGYLYPLSEQAAVVLDVLRIAIGERGIQIKTGAKVQKVQVNGSRFEVFYNDKNECFDRVILTCGSKAAPKTGSDGWGYEVAKTMGHRIVKVVPSLVQLRCRDSFCKALAGIRAEACIHIYEDGRELCKESGEVQLTDYGISGIPVFQLSALVNRRLSEKKHGEITASIDFLPGLSQADFQKWQNQRLERGCLGRNETLCVEEFFTGILNKKLMMVFIKLAGLKPDMAVKELSERQLRKVLDFCKGLTFHIEGHNGFENAQVCAGGVDMKEVTMDLESLKVPGLFFAGEILDVDGRCGGYNLQWAWTSGVIAGKGVCHDSN